MEEESDRLHGTVLDLCLEVWNKSHDGLVRALRFVWYARHRQGAPS